MSQRTASLLTMYRLCVFLLLVLLISTNAFAQKEQITNFASLVEINPDASVTVTENITVQSTGNKIKRGIYRWLQTRYTGSFGLVKNVRYDILSVERDGAPESWHIKHEADKSIIYLGRSDVILPPGQYTYTLKYKSWRQIGYFSDFDEIYWNVTGNYWEFPILQASCNVQLPKGTPIVQKTAYTGEQGEKGTAFTSHINDQDNVIFKTTAPIQPGQGFTVAVAWPKGIVSTPDSEERFFSYFQDNITAIIGGAGLIIVFLYYLFFWFRVGRDPERWTIVPLFEPPKDISPAASRFVMEMGFDNKTFAAALIDMAVKGHLQIDERKVAFLTVYTLTKRSDDMSTLSSGEKAISKVLFASQNSIELKKSNRNALKKAMNALKTRLKLENEKIYFKTNGSYLLPGVAITLLTLGAIILVSPNAAKGVILFMTFWLSIWTVGCSLLILAALGQWASRRFLQAIVFTLFALPFLGGEIMGLYLYSQATTIPTALCLVALVGLSGLFYQLLKAPTFAGRRLMDEIEGFKLFLSISEKERLELLHPPDRTPELFEKYLPYALALDVENQWSEQFDSVLARAGADQGYPHGYHPTWYSGNSWDSLGAGAFASSFGNSFSSAVGSASSSSGSSGGGGSGGGGGGGGGGGW